MKKNLPILIVVLLLLLTPTSSIATSDRYQQSVSMDNIFYVGGSGPNNYTHIQDAVFDASDGDTVFVFSGIYYEEVVVNKAIRLIGEDKNTTVIDADFEGISLRILSDDVYVSGFTMRNCRKVASNYDSSVILIKFVNNVTVAENILMIGEGYELGAYFPVIYIQNSSHIIINNNIIFDEEDISRSIGILTRENSSHIQIIENSISSYHFGVYFIDGENINLSENTIDNNHLGTLLISSDEIRISNNIIRNNKYQGIETNFMDNSVISGNIIANNGDCGILVWAWDNGGNNRFINNAIRHNGKCGLLLLMSTNNLISGNNFIGNGDGMKNYLIDEGNAFFSYNTRRIAHNTWNGNYWDDSVTGGILPYVVYGEKLFILMWHKWINIDWHPATEPYDIG